MSIDSFTREIATLDDHGKIIVQRVIGFLLHNCERLEEMLHHLCEIRGNYPKLHEKKCIRSRTSIDINDVGPSVGPANNTDKTCLERLPNSALDIQRKCTYLRLPMMSKCPKSHERNSKRSRISIDNNDVGPPAGPASNTEKTCLKRQCTCERSLSSVFNIQKKCTCLRLPMIINNDISRINRKKEKRCTFQFSENSNASSRLSMDNKYSFNTSSKNGKIYTEDKYKLEGRQSLQLNPEEEAYERLSQLMDNNDDNYGSKTAKFPTEMDIRSKYKLGSSESLQSNTEYEEYLMEVHSLNSNDNKENMGLSTQNTCICPVLTIGNGNNGNNFNKNISKGKKCSEIECAGQSLPMESNISDGRKSPPVQSDHTNHCENKYTTSMESNVSDGGKSPTMQSDHSNPGENKYTSSKESNVSDDRNTGMSTARTCICPVLPMDNGNNDSNCSKNICKGKKCSDIECAAQSLPMESNGSGSRKSLLMQSYHNNHGENKHSSSTESKVSDGRKKLPNHNVYSNHSEKKYTSSTESNVSDSRKKVFAKKNPCQRCLNIESAVGKNNMCSRCTSAVECCNGQNTIIELVHTAKPTNLAVAGRIINKKRRRKHICCTCSPSPDDILEEDLVRLDNESLPEENALTRWEHMIEIRNDIAKKIIKRTGKQSCQLLFNRRTTVDERDKRMMKNLIERAELSRRTEEHEKLVQYYECTSQCDVVVTLRQTLPRRKKRKAVEIIGLPAVTKEEILGENVCGQRSNWINSKYAKQQLKRKRATIRRVLHFFPDIEHLEVVGKAIQPSIVYIDSNTIELNDENCNFSFCTEEHSSNNAALTKGDS